MHIIKNKKMEVLKVNDQVNWRGSYGSDLLEKAVVVAIEIDCVNKYGQPVDKVEWSKVGNRETIVTLDNGHWAYGYQISKL